MAAAQTIDYGLGDRKWTPRERDLSLAEKDLEWWHALSASELGAHGSGFEPSTTGWDVEAIWRLFEQVFDPRRIESVRRFYKVAPVVHALTAEQRETAAAIYASRPYPVHLRLAWPCDRKDPGLVTLVGAALRSASVRAAFARSNGGHAPASMGVLLDWAADATRPRVVKVKVREGTQYVEREQQINNVLPKWASVALVEAQTMRDRLLTAYATAHHRRMVDGYL